MQSSSIDIAVTPATKPGLRLLLLPLVILAGMGLSVEAVHEESCCASYAKVLSGCSHLSHSSASR